MEAPKTTLDPERYKRKKIDKALIRLQLAVKDKDRKKKASAYQDLAWLYYDVKDYKQSIAYGKKSLDISAQMGNEELKVKANANNVLAWAHKDVGDYEKSQGFCRELLRIGDRLRDEQLKASAYEVKAWLFFADEDYAQSSEQGEKFLNASQNLKDKTLEAKALDVLAWSYLKQGKYEQSQNYGEQFLRISEDLSDQAVKAYALEVLAFVFYELENYKQSQKYGQDLLRISKELGKKEGEARACEVVAESYIQEGNDQEGRKYAEELLRISKELGKEQEAKAYQVLAKSYSKERKDQESRKYNKQLLRISKELGNKEKEAKACKALANSYIQGGDFRKSIGYGVELLRISKERGNKELEAHACDLLAKSHAEVGDSELSMEYGKELLSISEELGDKELKSKACCFLGWSDSELQKYEQSKEISKESPRVAKKEEGKTLQAEASGCSELPERQIFNLLRQIEQQAKEDTNNHETGLSENFKRNIKEKGFSISDNQGEGNSMFLALSEQLHLKKRIEISQAELRQTVVQYLKKKPTLLDGTELFHFVDGCSSWDVYLTRMMADGTWGDHVILYGAAHLFQTCIHVISSHHDKVMICPEYDANTRLVLGHVHELHYVSLIPQKDTHVPQAGKKPSFEQTGTPLYADKDDNAKVGEYSFRVERREENSGAYGLRNLSYLTHSTRTQYRPASFVAYFCPDIPDILYLICCSAHHKQEVIQDLEKRDVTFADGISMKDMIPGEDGDKAFVFLSGRIRPFNKEDVNNIHLRLLEEHPFKIEFRVRFVDGEDLAQVEFRNTLKQTDRKNLLCRLHLTSPSRKMPRAGLRELAPQPEIKGGSPTLNELERLSDKICDKWKNLDRRLKFEEAKITEHDNYNDRFSEKAYKLLMAWKQRDASAATYLVLHKALSDVGRRDLAEEFCCQ